MELVDAVELPATAKRSVEQQRAARRRLVAETVKEKNATRTAVRALISAGLSLADAGALLGLSRQRVHQVRNGTR